MKNYWSIITLIISGIFLCIQNYTPDTFLSGWDTLHPEFNFGSTIKREIFGVFRSYQGLGAVAAHSDMADLPRIILLYLLSPFIPMSFLRYFYIFATLIIGPIGVYYFLKRVVFSKTPKESTTPSFLGALFYLLNLGTMQQFIVPFEMFTIQYALLPWLFLFATEYLKDKNHQKKTLILFAVTTLFAAPMAYAATLWYIYFIAFTMYVFMLAMLRKNERVTRAFILLLLTLLINSFWILPNIYFIFTHGSEVPQANINRLFSHQAFLYNKEFGNIQDISFLKTFLFDWNVYSGNNNFVQLLQQWIAHLKQPIVQLSGFLFAGIAFFGIIYGIFKGNKILIALLPLLFLCLFFLLNDNSPTSSLYSFLQAKVPFLKEAYRFPQNKVLGIFTFLFAIYFATGQFLVTRLVASIKHQEGWRDWRNADRRSSSPARQAWNSHRVPAGSLRPKDLGCETKERQDPDGTKLQYVQVVVFAVLLFYFMLPAFKGNFISPYMRIKIPNYYFEMFSWFNKEKEDGRIASLPINSFWGWEYHNWYKNTFPSFQGAGFIWFGIKQPLLARDFDRWTPYNEQYYREMSYAIYSQDPKRLKIVLEKYNIKYILLDKSITAPPNPAKVLLYQETQELLEKQGFIQKIKEFGNTLIVYKLKTETLNDTHFVQNPGLISQNSQAKSGNQNSSEGAQAFYEDVAYKEYGNYIAKLGNVHYPLANLIDNQSRVLPNTLKITQEGVVIRLPKDRIDNFILPSFIDTQELVASDLLIEKNNHKLIITFYPHFPIKDSKDHPIPIVVETDLSEIENIVLSINKKDNFTLNLTPNIPLSLGTIYLNTKNENTIAIYPSTPNEEILPDLSAIEYYIEPCQDKTDQEMFGGFRAVPSFGVEKIQNNSFNIFAKNVSLCVTFPLSALIQKDLNYSEMLLNVTFDYESGVPLKFCVSKLINGACQNYRNNGLVEYFGLQKEDTKNLGLQFLLDTTNNDKDKIVKAFYSNIGLKVAYPLFLKALPNDALKKSLNTMQNLSKTTTLILPYSSNKELSTDITKFPITSGYCPKGLVSNSAVIKKQILENNNDRFIRYESLDGVSCDHFSYQNLSQNQAYLVAITSRNVKGLPLTLCMTNHVSKHCDIYANLSSYKDFNTDIFLLPPQIKNEIGFDVNISNLGIKKSPSINDLKSIQIIPFPYTWLTQIRHSEEPSPHPLSLRERVRDLLVLPYSFEKGWKAYQVQSSKFKVQSFFISSFPFLFGQELKDHMLVNSWANGWILDNSTMKQFNNSTIVVFFIPQYLEYIGFLLLLGTAAWLIKKI